MRVTCFRSVTDTRAQTLDRPWNEIVENILIPFDIRPKKDGPLYSFAAYEKTATRGDANVQAVTGAVFDFDEGSELPEALMTELVFACAWHSTHSSTPQSPRWRLVVPFDKEIQPAQFPAAWKALYFRLGRPPGVDPSCLDLSRAYYLPSCPTEHEGHAFAGTIDAPMISVEDLLEITIPAVATETPKPHGRNDTLKSIARAMLGRGEFFEAIVSELVSHDKAHHKIPLFTDESEGMKAPAELSAAKFLLNISRSVDISPTFRGTEVVILSDKTPQKIEARPLPEFLFQPPGLVGQVYEYIIKRAIKPQPELTLAAAFTACGTVMGRKVRTETDLRTNLYFLAVAETGSGKEWPRRAVQRIFTSIGKFDRAQVEDVASDTAILEITAKVPSQVLLLDEFGRFLATTGQQAKSHLFQIPSLLLRLYNSANSSFSGKIYADKDRNKVVEQPNISLFGTTVEASFYRAITSESASDGFLNRIIFMKSRDPDPKPNFDESDFDPPAQITEAFKAWESLPYRPSGNLDSVENLPPSPRIVPATPEANQVFADAENDLRQVRHNLRAEGYAGLYTRVTDSARRLALILAAGENLEAPQISEANAVYGVTLARLTTDALLQECRRHVADNITESNAKRVLELIRAHGPLSTNALYSKTRWLTRSQRQEILQSLTLAGEVAETQQKNAGRVRTVWEYRTASEG